MSGTIFRDDITCPKSGDRILRLTLASGVTEHVRVPEAMVNDMLRALTASIP